MIIDKIKLLQKQIEELPDGKLIYSTSANRIKWYKSTEEGRTYIPKSERNTAEQLAIKRYLSVQIEDLTEELQAVETYLNHINKNSSKTDEFFANNPIAEHFLKEYLTQELNTGKIWMEAPYDKNPYHPEHLVHKALPGLFVRSKSEAMIARALTEHGIPFRYEAELPIGKYKLYPDFTILMTKSNTIKYWEHFGMMDDAGYCKKNLWRLDQYTNAGIYIKDDLILTYETLAHPLSYEEVERVIQEHFICKL